jgi:hypothetical protein
LAFPDDWKYECTGENPVTTYMTASPLLEYTAFDKSQGSSPCYEIKPLEDPRWPALLKSHPRSSLFHTVEWLGALRQTYGYEPIAFTTTPPGAELQNAVVFCRVESWLTGRRLVSVPFSDHCDPLANATRDLRTILSALEKKVRDERLRYIEMRPTPALGLCAVGSCSSMYPYCLHQIDLTPELNTLFANCHKNSIQRKIRRAEREGLTYAEGRSEFLLDCFYRLLILTRRRHATFPQPKRWFKTLIERFDESLKIRVTFTDNQPIAAILTLSHKKTLYYKYGCSDPHFHRLGGMQCLLWRSLREAKTTGLAVFDLGRSDCDNPGLIAFKNHWGAARSALTYLRLLEARSMGSEWKKRLAKWLLPHLSDRMLCAVGDSLRRHFG